MGAVLAATLTMPVVAPAQSTKPIYYANGGASNSVNYITAPGSNTFYLEASEIEKLPLRVTIKAPGAATSVVMWYGYRQLETDVYETVPFFTTFSTLNGTTAVTAITNLDVAGGSTIKLVIGNTNATIAITNLAVVTRPKAPKRAVFNTSR